MLTYLGPSILGSATLALLGRSIGCWVACARVPPARSRHPPCAARSTSLFHGLRPPRRARRPAAASGGGALRVVALGAHAPRGGRPVARRTRGAERRRQRRRATDAHGERLTSHRALPAAAALVATRLLPAAARGGRLAARRRLLAVAAGARLSTPSLPTPPFPACPRSGGDASQPGQSSHSCRLSRAAAAAAGQGQSDGQGSIVARIFWQADIQHRGSGVKSKPAQGCGPASEQCPVGPRAAVGQGGARSAGSRDPPEGSRKGGSAS